MVPEIRYIDEGTPVVNPNPSTSHVAAALRSVQILATNETDIYVNLTKSCLNLHTKFLKQSNDVKIRRYCNRSPPIFR